MTRKRILVLLGSVCLALMLVVPMVTACAAPAPTPSPTPTPTPAPEKIVIRLIHAYPETTQHGRNSDLFAELADKYTDGRVEVIEFPNAQVCPISKEPTVVLGGGAEMTYNIAGVWELVNPAEAIWSVPFLSKGSPGDMRHCRAIYFDPVIFGELAKIDASKGFKRLMAPSTVNGFSFFTNPYPILTVEDFKGLKMRSPGGLLGDYFFNALGASAITIAGTEVPVALEQGTVDGLTTVPLHWFDARWITKYWTYPYWCSYSMVLEANMGWWNSLPEDIRDILENKVIPEVCEYSFSSVERLEVELLDLVTKPPYNVEIYEISQEELKRMEELTQAGGIELFQETVGKELADKLIDRVRELTPADLK